MGKSVSDLQRDNKLLMMELQKLNVDPKNGSRTRSEVIKDLERNNRDLQAMAAALGPRDEMPRLHRMKKMQGYEKK